MNSYVIWALVLFAVGGAELAMSFNYGNETKQAVEASGFTDVVP